MNKTIIWIILSVAGLITLSVISVRWLTMRVNTDFATEALLEFHYGDINISVTITDEDDILMLKQILNGRAYYRGSLHCGFIEDISITMTSGRKSIMFCPANDGCQLLRVDTSCRYIEISYEANTQLHEILGKYGMIFPCI